MIRLWGPRTASAREITMGVLILVTLLSVFALLTAVAIHGC